MAERVVMVGASGFGREALDVLEAMQAAGAAVDVLGVIDDRPSPENLQRLAERGVAYLGTITDWLADEPAAAAYVLGIGSPTVRRVLVEKLDAHGCRPFTAIHPGASIGSRATIGPGVVICAGAVISTNVRLARHVHVNPNATVGHDAVLGEFCSLNPGSVISGEVTIEPGVLVGASATVLQQLTVGADTTVGAAALVTKDVPSGVVVKGVPGAWG